MITMREINESEDDKGIAAAIQVYTMQGLKTHPNVPTIAGQMMTAARSRGNKMSADDAVSGAIAKTGGFVADKGAQKKGAEFTPQGQPTNQAKPRVQVDRHRKDKSGRSLQHDRYYSDKKPAADQVKKALGKARQKAKQDIGTGFNYADRFAGKANLRR